MPGLSKELTALGLQEDWDSNLAEPYGMHANSMAAPQSEKLHEVLRKAAKSTPRYLFRRWTPSSGGHNGLNTTAAITPLAFLNEKNCPTSIFGMDPHHLHSLINGHLAGDFIKTVFSSWSHSLPMILAWANHDPASYISVIDTRQLRRVNFIIHCGASELNDVDIAKYGEEFLIFGVIEGKGHRAVQVRELRTLVGGLLGNMHVSSSVGLHYELQGKKKLSASARLTQATNLGRAFGPELELPVAIHLLATMTGDAHGMDKYYEALARDFNVPTAWACNTSFPNLPKNREGQVEYLAIACKAMTVVVDRLRDTGRLPVKMTRSGRNGKKADEKTKEGKEATEEVEIGEDKYEKEAEDEAEEARVDTASKHLKKPSRMPKAVYQLYIDMLGFEAHNDAVSG